MPNTQVQIAITLFWASVGLGLLNLGLHAYQATGSVDAAPLLMTAAIFIFVQARLLLRLYSGSATVRTRLAIITLLRFAVLAPSLPTLFAVTPARALLPAVSALVQVVALALVFLPPGSAYFAKPVPARRAAARV